MYPSPFPPLTLAVPNWPHAAPLLAGLDERGDLAIASMAPGDVIEALRNRSCACALVPPALLLADPDLAVIPGAGLVAGATCNSEQLIATSPLEAIRRVRVAVEAQPLSLYLQCIFAARGLPLPELVSWDRAESADAQLLSGADQRAPDAQGYNVAELWRATTDTPLVLGVWACHASHAIRRLRTLLGEAAQRGIAEGDQPPLGGGAYTYQLLSAESDCLRTLHRLARTHAIAGATVESIAFC